MARGQWSRAAYQCLLGEDFEEEDEMRAVAQVIEQVSDVSVHLAQVFVDPFGERLLLDLVPLICK